MKKLIIFALCVSIHSHVFSQPIVADHTVIDQYSQIPDQWIDSVNKMLLAYPGESHSRGLIYGFQSLDTLDGRLKTNFYSGGFPPSPIDSAIRIHSARYDTTSAFSYDYDSPFRWRVGGGEQHLWTSDRAVGCLKAQISYARDTLSIPYHAYCFGWCWDMCWQSTCSNIGEFTGRAYYWSEPSCTGQSCWNGSYQNNWDTSHTQINLQMYLDAWHEVATENPDMAMIYSTGPVDGGCADNCAGFQRFVKHEYIRKWVQQDDRYLFDYADILNWNNAGLQNTTTVDSETFPLIHPDNDAEYDGGLGSCHISRTGCIRLAKGMTWLLARISGWNGTLTKEKSITNPNTHITIYPNPNDGNFYVSPPVDAENLTIKIIDRSGFIAWQKEITTNRKRISICTDHLISGFYIVSVIAGNNVYYSSIMIK